ncbi:MAG: hypothetical protein LBS59_07915 [Puniceicoccales bacterium]|jgi:hypothetical protein|nr:hypothetical protein [Puniceicoccales bacterium]
MFRVFTAVLLLLAYSLASMAHCPIAETICANGGRAACTEHSDEHAVPHGSDCQLELELGTAPAPAGDFSNSAKVGEKTLPLLVAYCLHCFRCIAAAPSEIIAVPAATRSNLICLAKSWQFSSRTAGFARAP